MGRIAGSGRRIKIVASGKIYNNAAELAEELGVQPSHIYKILKGTRRTSPLDLKIAWVNENEEV